MTSRKENLDRMATIMKDVPPDRLRSALAKEGTIQIRVSATEKAEMQRVAKTCNLTLTDYLCRLHAVAAQKLAGKG